MRFLGFVGPTYSLQSVNVDCQRCINLYPEINELGTGNEQEVASLVSTPGLRLLTTLPTGPIRGEYTDSSGNLWVVAGDAIYQISDEWDYTFIGTLQTQSGPVSFADNGIQMVVVDGPFGYQINISTNLPINYMAAVSTDFGSNTGNGDFETGTTAGWSLAHSPLTDLVPTAVAPAGTAFSSTMGGTTASTNLSLAANATDPIAGTYSGWLTSIAASTVGDMLISSGFFINEGDQSSNLDISFAFRAGAGATIDFSGTSGNSFGIFIYDITNAAWISPNGVYNMVVDSNGNGSAIASFPTTSNTSEYQIALVNINAISAASILVIDSFDIGPSSAEFQLITDPNFLGSDQVTFMDGYFIFNKPGSQEFFLSPLNAVTPFNGLDVSSAEAAPDPIVGHIALQENVYFFGSQTLEIFYDSGNENFPIQRIQGAVSEIGCVSAFTICKIQNTVFWLGTDKNGRGIVYSASGLIPQRISNLAVETEIAKLGDLSGSTAWSYQQGGHSFYCLNLPGAETTWVYESLSGMWHERAYFSQGSFQRHLAECHAFAYDTNVVGDYSSGNLYALDPTVFTDNGKSLVRERISPHISKDMVRMIHSSFQLDVETGVGKDGSGQGINPQVMLQWSNDYAHSWSNEHWKSMGSIGARRTRSIWRRLGKARDRVYRVRISDPVKVTLLGAEIDIEECAS